MKSTLRKGIAAVLLALASAGGPVFADEPAIPEPSIASNPATVNVLAGSGSAQKYLEKKLGIQNDYGLRIGGALIGNINELFSGGNPNGKATSSNGLLQLGIALDTEKFIGWKGGMFDVDFLQFNGSATNLYAGSVQGYNSLPGAPPLQRFEVYQLWYLQELFNKKLFIRIGKQIPSMTFNNVVKPVPLAAQNEQIPAVSGLIFTPLFVNASMLGVLPGYYNSAYGAAITLSPTKRWYISYGLFDGALASGKQTGLTGPIFNGSYFNIAETGISWLAGVNKLPGDVAVGAWRQTGLVQASPTLFAHGAQGYYLFASQRLWYRHPRIDKSGISSFLQYGKNTSMVLPMTKYLGAGFTAFALIPDRENDSMGIGAAYSWLNQHTFTRKNELILQAYYQAKIMSAFYLEPVISYIPKPGANPNYSAAWAGTVQAIVLF